MPPVDDQIFARFRELCEIPSDINEHLGTLKEYADRCSHVTEFGVRGCVSLHAFLASKARTVVAYDIANVATPSDCEKLTFVCADVLQIEIEPTDLLFIDTIHTYDQLRQELELHSPKVRRFIGMHDSEMFGGNGEDGGPGLNIAIHEFLTAHPEWHECYRSHANNGLTILARC